MPFKPAELEFKAVVLVSAINQLRWFSQDVLVDCGYGDDCFHLHVCMLKLQAFVASIASPSAGSKATRVHLIDLAASISSVNQQLQRLTMSCLQL